MANAVIEGGPDALDDVSQNRGEYRDGGNQGPRDCPERARSGPSLRRARRSALGRPRRQQHATTMTSDYPSCTAITADVAQLVCAEPTKQGDCACPFPEKTVSKTVDPSRGPKVRIPVYPPQNLHWFWQVIRIIKTAFRCIRGVSVVLRMLQVSRDIPPGSERGDDLLTRRVRPIRPITRRCTGRGLATARVRKARYAILDQLSRKQSPVDQHHDAGPRE
ncbi:hypothetical protein SAMN05444415_106235 [Salipiger profundus]|jgi:hypothetical protein|nr:hypothetical protein SAMN05444415_106235 [Salipiger profundus]